MVAINTKFERSAAAKLYGEPGVMDLVTRRARVSDIDESVLRKVRIESVSRFAKYLHVRGIVRKVLDGESESDVHEVSYGTLPDKDIARFDGRHVYLPRVSDIPHVYGGRYSAALRMSGLGPDKFNRGQRNYIHMHELVESEYVNKHGSVGFDGKKRLSTEQHGEMEALMYRALNELEARGYKGAGDISHAGQIMHSARDNTDPFKMLTRKYMTDGGSLN